MTPDKSAAENPAVKYEMMFIVSPMLTESKRKSVIKELDDLIKSKGGSVFHIDDWGKRELSYSIKKFDEGYYLIYYFTLNAPQDISEIDEHMGLDQGILRHLIIRRDEDFEIVDFTQFEEEEEERKEKTKEEKPAKPKKEDKPKAESKKTEDTSKENEEAKESDSKDKDEDSEELDKKLDAIISDSDLEI